MLGRLIIGLLVSAAALFVGSEFLPNVRIDGFTTAIIAAAVLAVANTFIRPIVNFFSTPFRWMTLGLFCWVVNAAMIMLTAYFVDGFALDGMFYGFIWALALGVVIAIVQSVLETVLGIGRRLT